MWENPIFLLPGPTQVPPRVLRAMSAPMVNHRGPKFKELLDECIPGIQKILQTKNDICLLTSSGTGGMEAAVANFIGRGEKAIVVSVGSFGYRFKALCDKYGVEAELMDFTWGTAADPQKVKERLQQDQNHEIKAILIQHNETSTAVLNDIEAISKAKGNHPALLIVDAISGLAAADLQTDNWGIDVVIAGAQKAFMIPPGLAMVSVSDRAWEAAEKINSQSLYFDLKAYKEFLQKGQTPYTPAISLVFGLKEALNIMLEEGLENIFKRHILYRDMVRQGVKALGLDLFVADDIASPAVTAVKAPEGIPAGEITRIMREDYNVVLAGGQQHLKDKIFRIGHLGYVQPMEIIAALAALELTLEKLGFKVTRGAAVTAAEKVLKERRD